MVKKGKVKFTGVNKEILRWKSGTTAALKSQIGMLTSEGKGELMKNLSGYVNQDADGAISSLSWRFPRHGIFLIKGVGRGYVIEDGRVIRAVRKNNTLYMISDTIEREPKDWFNPVIEQRIPKLSKMVADYYADQGVKQIDGHKPRTVTGINKSFNI